MNQYQEKVNKKIRPYKLFVTVFIAVSTIICLFISYDIARDVQLTIGNEINTEESINYFRFAIFAFLSLFMNGMLFVILRLVINIYKESFIQRLISYDQLKKENLEEEKSS